MPKSKNPVYYAVKAGKNPGVYNSWDECKANAYGYAGAKWKKFHNYEEARSFIEGSQPSPPIIKAVTKPSKRPSPSENPREFYALVSESHSAIYTTLDKLREVYCEDRDICRRFFSYEEAEEFLRKHSENISNISPENNRKLPQSSYIRSGDIHSEERKPPIYYAVRHGRKPGVYSTWVDCRQQVIDYPGAWFRECTTLKEARLFVEAGKSPFYEQEEYLPPLMSPITPTPFPNTEPQVTKRRRGRPPKTSYTTPVHKQIVFSSSEPMDSLHFETQILPSPLMTTNHSVINHSPQSQQTPVSFSHQNNSELFCPPNESNIRITPMNSSNAFEQNSPISHRPESENSLTRSPSGDTFHSTDHHTSSRNTPAADEEVLSATNHTDKNIVYITASSHIEGDTTKSEYSVFWGNDDPRNLNESLTGTLQTIQRAEIMAAIRALEASHSDQELEVRTDSHYVFNFATDFSRKWPMNNWKSSSGLEIQNRDLFEQLLGLIEKRTSKTYWRLIDQNNPVPPNITICNNSLEQM